MSVTEQKARVNIQIQDLRKKIQLTEGESKAFYEESEAEKHNNKEAIAQIRADVKQLHVKIEEANHGSERIIEKVFLQRRRAVSSASSVVPRRVVKKTDATLQSLEYKLHDLVKKLNFLQHIEKQKEGRLNSLKEQFEAAGPQRAQDDEALIAFLKEEHVALDNELDRMAVQVSEGETIHRRYVAMESALRGEAASYRTALDNLLSKLNGEKVALKKLRESRKKAEKTRDGLRSRLHEEEEKAYDTKMERETTLSEHRNRAEEGRIQNAKEAGDRRMSIQKVAQKRDSGPQGMGEQTPEEANAEMEMFQQLFSKLKEVLGITTVDEVVERLTTQADTKEHLRQMKALTQMEVNRLKEEREALQVELYNLKFESYEDSSKSINEFQELEENLVKKEEEKLELKEELESNMKILAGIRACLEHAAEKLQRGDRQRPERSESSLRYLVQLMEYCMSLSEELLEELDPTQVENKLEEMAEEEKENGGTTTSPENLRVNFPTSSSETKGPQQQGEDAADSGEEEESMTRRFIKRQAQMIVEAKSRKRNRPVATFKS